MKLVQKLVGETDARFILALTSLLGTLGMSFLAVLFGNWDALQAIWTTSGLLTATAFGFYFSSKQSEVARTG